MVKYIDGKPPPFQDRRLLLNSLFLSMTLLGKSLTCVPKEAVSVLSKRVKEKIEREKSFEPKIPLSNKGRNGKVVNSDFVLRTWESSIKYLKEQNKKNKKL